MNRQSVVTILASWIVLLGLAGCQTSESERVSETALRDDPQETPQVVQENDALGVLLDAKRRHLKSPERSYRFEISGPNTDIPGPLFSYGTKMVASGSLTTQEGARLYHPEFSSIVDLTQDEVNAMQPRAEAGNAEAIRTMALAAIYHARGKPDTKATKQGVLSAASLLKEMAKNGDPRLQSIVGFLYMTGEGVVKNDNIAAQWFRKAAEQGYAPAMSKLATLYLTRTGAARDEVLAKDWLKRAYDARDGNALFLTALTRLSVTSGQAEIDEAILLIAESAETDYAPAQFTLGAYLLESDMSDAQNEASVRLVRSAAFAGYAPAQHKLATLYDEGVEVSRSRIAALIWFMRGAQQGHAESQYQLAIEAFYREKYAGARELLYRAVQGGHMDARNRLAVMHEIGDGGPKDLVVARTWYILGSELEEPLNSPDVIRVSSKMSRRDVALSNSFLASCLILSDSYPGPSCKVRKRDGRPVGPSSAVSVTAGDRLSLKVHPN